MEKLFGIEMDVLAIALFSGMLVIILLTIFLATRNRVLIKLALRNIPRRKAQTLLIITGLMLSTTIIMAALAIGDSINSAIRLGALHSLGGTDVRLSSPVFSRFGDNYLDETVVDEVRFALQGDTRVDGILPLIREKMPVINETSGKTVSDAVIVGVDLNSMNGFTDVLGTEENGPIKIDIRNLQEGETVINKPLSDKLDLRIDDLLTLVSATGRTQHKVVAIVDPVGLIGGTESSRSSALFPVKTVQRLFNRDAKYNIIEVSVTGDYAVEGVTYDEIKSEEVAKKLSLAFINNQAVNELFNLLKTPKVVKAIKSELTERENDSSNPIFSDRLADLLPELDKDIPSDELKMAIADSLTQAKILGLIEKLEDENLTQSLFFAMSELVELNVDSIKTRSLEFAEIISSGIVLFFTIFGSFSIIVGLMLIFLVFVMLAASRTTEMGILRAIGTKRRHLVQMFTYEGLLYSLGASIAGTVLGLLASVLLMQLMIRGFADEDEITFYYSVTFQSIIIAFSAGFVLTALTVTISAYRVSKLNIVVAIRGLSEEFVTDEIPNAKQRAITILKWIFGPFTFAYETWFIWRSGQGIVIRILTIMGLLLIFPWFLIIIWKIFKFFQPWLLTGWPLLPIGIIMTVYGLDPEKGIKGFGLGNAALVSVGISFAIVSLGLIIRSFLGRRGYRDELQKRVSMTFIGLGMLTFYALPFDALEDITGELDGGPEMFVLSGVSLVAASVWVIMHNADVIVWIISKLIGRWGGLRPVVKLAIAYPMAARLRTGLTLAMFSLVIFTMMIFAILINLGNVLVDEPDRASGGFDIRATIRPELPIDDPYEVLALGTGKLSTTDFKVITSQARVRVEVRQDGGEEMQYKNARIRASDESWLQNNTYQLTHWDSEYGGTSAEIWEAVATNPELAVVAGNIISTDDGFGPPVDPSSFKIEGIDPAEKGQIKSVSITLRPPIGQGSLDTAVKRKVIGVLDSFADSFENSGNDIYMHHSVLQQVSDKFVPFTEYKFKLSDPLRADEVALLLDTVFIEHGMKSRSIKSVIDESQTQSNAFNQLFQGFMGLGLLVGVASIGVIAFRAVVERRQSIGMMRAIGFKERMVQLQFLMESGIVAVLGSVLGIGLGTLIAWNIFKTISQESEGVTFAIPWGNVGMVVLVTLIFSLVTTFLPARQASKISPSEALRYE